MRFLSKLFLLTPFVFLLVNNFNLDEGLYFQGLYGLVVLGLLGILFEINLILGIIYVLIGLGIYGYFVEFNINYLWGVGGLLLLVGDKLKIKKKVKETVCEVERSVPERVPEPRVMSREELFWARYDERHKKGKIKNWLKKNLGGALQR